MPSKKKSTAMFAIGDSVRVKLGIADPDYPDIPIGGWAGHVVEREEGETWFYLVSWSRHTLNSMAAIYRSRCERDGLDIKQMWVAEHDLEGDVGDPVEIVQPPASKPEPLDLKYQDDRIRLVFGLTHDDPVPEVTTDALRTYREYLSMNLSFPFEAWAKTTPRLFFNKAQAVAVIGLGSDDEDGRIDEHYGLICEIKTGRKRGDAPLAELEVKGLGGERQLINDYSYWFFNWR